MQKPSRNEAIAKSYENIYDHGQRVRVKAWQMSRGSNHAEVQQLLAAADDCDRSLTSMVLWDASVWGR